MIYSIHPIDQMTIHICNKRCIIKSTFLNDKFLRQLFSKTATNVINRYRHTIAIARQLPDSFQHAISMQNDQTSEDGIIDFARAKQQHESYIVALRQCLPVLELPVLQSSLASKHESDETNIGTTIRNDHESSNTNIQVQNDYPDSAFVEDTAIVIGEFALVTRLGHPSRRGECDTIHNTLKQLGMHVLNMNHYYNSTDWIYGSRGTISGSSSIPGELAIVDGGDVLYTGRHIFVGLSNRTNMEGATFIKQFFSSYDVIVVPPIQIDPAIKLPHTKPLHLKSAVTHIDEATLLAPIGPYGDELLAAMNVEEFGYKVYRIPDLLSCNAITCNGQVIVQDTICEKSHEILYNAVMNSDQDLIRVDTSELAKKDAALTCCSILLEI
jgi:dimethylargininase